MYYAQIQYNAGPWRDSPVRFITRELAENHAEKLAEQFHDISDYRVIEVSAVTSLKEALQPFNATFQQELAK